MSNFFLTVKFLSCVSFCLAAQKKDKRTLKVEKMTPPMPECPASSELFMSSSRSQGISGGGVRDGALLAPLCLQSSSGTPNSGNAGVRDPHLHFRGRSRGVGQKRRFSDLQALSPEVEKRISMIPKRSGMRISACLDTMPKECRQSEN